MNLCILSAYVVQLDILVLIKNYIIQEISNMFYGTVQYICILHCIANPFKLLCIVLHKNTVSILILNFDQFVKNYEFLIWIHFHLGSAQHIKDFNYDVILQ